jgi:hypothetical protein
VYGRLEISESCGGGHEGAAVGITRPVNKANEPATAGDEVFEVDGRDCFSPPALILNPNWCR